MKNLFSKLGQIFIWLWNRPETKEALTAVQAKILADGKDIAMLAIAEVKAGNLTDTNEKRKAAVERIKGTLLLKGKTYPDWAYNWLMEHIYAKFVDTK